VSPTSRNEQRVLWAYWISCGLAVVGGVSPFLLAGGSNRLSGALLPFGLAAVAFGACALLYQRGKSVASGLYLVASLAIVYGMLTLLGVPLRLAVEGICPPAPANCPIGFERPMTSAESTALGFAIGMGIVALLTSSFGLVTLYALLRPSTSYGPGTKTVDTRTPAVETPPLAPASPIAAKPEAEVSPEVSSPQPEPEAELGPELELPAHEPELELPAHTPQPHFPDPPAVEAPETSSLAPPPPSKPRRRRVPKVSPEPPTTPGSDA
jgi:hypothetical protein